MSSYTKRCWRQEIQAELEVWSIPYFSDLSILTTSAPNAKLKRKIKFLWWYERKTKLPTWYSMASQDTVWVSGIHHFRIQKNRFLRRSYSWCLIRSWYEQLGAELFVWIADTHLNFIPRPNHHRVTYPSMECAKARGERTDLGDTPPHAGVRSGLGGVAAGRGEAGAAAPRGRETGRGHPGVSPAAHADEAAAPPRRQVCAGIGGSGRRGGRSGHGDRAGTRHGRRQTGSGALLLPQLPKRQAGKQRARSA
jgi:hypothetical protein